VDGFAALAITQPDAAAGLAPASWRAQGEAIYPVAPDAGQAGQAASAGGVTRAAGIEGTCPANRDGAAAPSLRAVARSTTGIAENIPQRPRIALQ